MFVEFARVDGLAEDELLRLAASAEQFSEHPLAKAIVAAAQNADCTYLIQTKFSSTPGVGVEADVEG